MSRILIVVLALAAAAGALSACATTDSEDRTGNAYTTALGGYH